MNATAQSAAIKTLIPELGLKEYWYPALDERKVGKRPVGRKLLGENLVFFRAKDGRVVAATNTCPHRGGSLMHGDCHYQGTVACPYHGWVFDEQGECVAVLSEGPESSVPGTVKLRMYPTATLKGFVFVWMGQGEPAPLQEDVPPEFFEDDDTLLFISVRNWAVNWRVGLENSLDSHVMYVHRNAVLQLMEPIQQFGRVGYQPKVVNGRSCVGYLKDPPRSGREFYPGVNGYWPKTEWRKLWLWAFRWRTNRLKRFRPFHEGNEEWGMYALVDGKYVRAGGHHLPSMFRFDFNGQMLTRFCVPVSEQLTQIVYAHAVRRRSWLGKLQSALYFHMFRNWALNINFSTQDYRVMATQDYDAPENLSTSDGEVVRWRRLLLSARGMPKDPGRQLRGGSNDSLAA
jgi:phenylpropionate dioxygenase-like ring-hydroxylating dioxygenase large terminal subunit